jgi:TRAP-type C4-dicarboxylate transport system substrate-binding protein
MTKKPIKTTADIGVLESRPMRKRRHREESGAAPVTMPVSETYDALSRGIVDGTLFPVEALQGSKSVKWSGQSWKITEVLHDIDVLS